VGAGELGSRHLQSLLSHKQKDESREVFVFDPSLPSLELAKKRASEVVMDSETKVVYSDQLNFSVVSFELVVVATNASVRLAVIKDVIGKYSVKYLLLEKILFQNTEDLHHAADLLSQHSDKVWVNCPRRYFPFYQKLADLLDGQLINKMIVKGNRWGMACNSIHFLDLWFYLVSAERYDIELSGLSNKLVDSKRSGFKEITGEIVCDSSSKSLLLECSNDETLDVSTEISIYTEKYIININEISADAKVYNIDTSSEEVLDFAVLYQSQMTGYVASDICIKGVCDLTPFDESVAIHFPFLSALLPFFQEKDSKELTHCPIT